MLNKSDLYKKEGILKLDLFKKSLLINFRKKILYSFKKSFNLSMSVPEKELIKLEKKKQATLVWYFPKFSLHRRNQSDNKRMF